jgi:hypothetical protein
MRKRIVTKSKMEKMEKLIVGDKPLIKQCKSSNKKSKEHPNMKNREQGPGSKEQGAGSREQGAENRENRAGTGDCIQLPKVTLRHVVGDEKSLTPQQSRQLRFLKEYRACFFNVTLACKRIGIARKTFYRWKQDEGFRTELDITQEELKDFIRGKLLELIDQGNLIAIIFGCKAICGMAEAQGQQRIKMEHTFHSKETIDAVVY